MRTAQTRELGHVWSGSFLHSSRLNLFLVVDLFLLLAANGSKKRASPSFLKLQTALLPKSDKIFYPIYLGFPLILDGCLSKNVPLERVRPYLHISFQFKISQSKL